MRYMPLIWIVWAVFTATLLLLLLYRGTLTRYEEDQLFLEDSSSRQHEQNDALLRKIDKINPFVRACTGATCALSAAILGIYVWDAIRQFYM